MGEFTLASNASRSELPVAGFVVDFGRDLLRDAQGSTVPLRPRAWAVLRCLATNAGRLVTKDEFVSGISIIPSRGIRIFPTHLLQGASDGTGRSES